MFSRESEMVPLHKIVVPDKYKREKSQELAREEGYLIQSIKQVGLRFPIILKRKGTDYVLVDGYRRLRAFKKMKGEKIPSYVIPETEVTDLDILRFQLNVHRENLKPMDEARLIKSLIVEQQWTKQDAAKAIGKKVGTINRYFDCLKVGPKWQRLVNDGILSLFDIQPVAALSSKGQRQLYDTIKKRELPMNGKTVRVIYESMDPIKHPDWFNRAKQVADARINERHGHPVEYKKVEGVARMNIITDHRENVLKRYEDEINAVIPIIEDILTNKEMCEALPSRSLKSFAEFAEEYCN